MSDLISELDLEVPTRYQQILSLFIRIALALSVPLGRPRVAPHRADQLMYVGLAALVPGVYGTMKYAACPVIRTFAGAALFNLLATAVVPVLIAYGVDKLMVETVIPKAQPYLPDVPPHYWRWAPTAVVVAVLVATQPKVDRFIVGIIGDHLG